jgi:hypothetical protein
MTELKHELHFKLTFQKIQPLSKKNKKMEVNMVL